MSTAPVPDLAPIPGMCPGVAVLAGNGDGGGGSGKGGKDGTGDDHAGTGDGKNDASGDPKNGGEGCGDPVCPITGRVFCHIFDFGYGGPLTLRWVRAYNSRRAGAASEIGFGWTHPYAWSLRLKPHRTLVCDSEFKEQLFGPLPESGEPVRNDVGWSVRRDAEGISLRLPDGDRYLFGPDVGGGLHCLIALLDRNGNRITLQRDDRGTLTGLIDSAGRPYRVTSDALGRILAIAVALDATGQQWMDVVQYAYDENGDLVAATDAEGHTARYAYFNHLLTEHQSVSGLSYCYRYDGHTQDAYCVETWGEYIGSTDPALEHPLPVRPATNDRRKVKGINYVRLTYQKAAFYSEAENGLGGLYRFFGDESGRVVKRVDPAGGVNERSYSAQSGARAGHSDPHGTPVELFSDALGNTVGYRDANGEGIVRIEEADGTILEINQHTGGMGRRKLDSRGNLVFIEHPDGTKEEFEYDSRGLITWRRDRTGAGWKYENDEFGNNIWIEGPGGLEVSEFDYLGRRLAHWDSSGRETRWSYDRRSEIVQKRHADGSEIRVVRDANRKLVQMEEAGRITRYEYGGMAWVTRIERPGGDSREYRYDTEGNLTVIRNGRGQEFRQLWDAASRCIGCIDFEGVRRDAGYNGARDAIWIETPSGREVREYDDAGRLVGAELPDGMAIKLEFGTGGPSVIDNGQSRIDREFDLVGRIVHEKNGPHDTRVVWAAGMVAKIVSSVGLPVQLGTEAYGESAKITVGGSVVRIGEPQGQDLLTYFGSLVLRRRFGPTDMLVRRSVARFNPEVPVEVVATSADPNLISWSTYEYDHAQLLRRETRSDGRVIEYDVDAADHVLARRIYSGGVLLNEERLAYDRVGTPQFANAKYDSLGRPAAFKNEDFEYDAVGQLSRRRTDVGDWIYEWSAAGNLISVLAPDRDVRMEYDGRGRRTRKRVLREHELVSSTSYVWDNETVLHEVNDLDHSTRTYVRPREAFAPIGHVDLINGQEIAYLYVLNPANAPDFALDMRGNVVWSQESTVFGSRLGGVDDVPIDVRFENQHWDADVELAYNRNRWYDARLGVYTSTDPSLLDGTFNPRDYVSNPLRYVDPMGLVSRTPARGSDLRPAPGASRGAPDNHHDRPDRPRDTDAMDGNYMGRPGHHATNGTPACPGNIDCPPGSLNATSFPAHVQRGVDDAGNRYGCHSCGSRNPNGPDGAPPGPGAHWTCDHQPPACTYNNGVERGQPLPANGSPVPHPRPGSVRLYPHCQRCSRSQGGLVSGLSDAERNRMRTDGVARNRHDSNQNFPNTHTPRR